MKGVQCYELFGGIALKNHTFSFFILLLISPLLAKSWNVLLNACKQFCVFFMEDERATLIAYKQYLVANKSRNCVLPSDLNLNIVNLLFLDFLYDRRRSYLALRRTTLMESNYGENI